MSESYEISLDSPFGKKIFETTKMDTGENYIYWSPWNSIKHKQPEKHYCYLVHVANSINQGTIVTGFYGEDGWSLDLLTDMKPIDELNQESEYDWKVTHFMPSPKYPNRED